VRKNVQKLYFLHEVSVPTILAGNFFAVNQSRSDVGEEAEVLEFASEMGCET
jgi:hypothetical protein